MISHRHAAMDDRSVYRLLCIAAWIYSIWLILAGCVAAYETYDEYIDNAETQSSAFDWATEAIFSIHQFPFAATTQVHFVPPGAMLLTGFLFLMGAIAGPYAKRGQWFLLMAALLVCMVQIVSLIAFARNLGWGSFWYSSNRTDYLHLANSVVWSLTYPILWAAVVARSLHSSRRIKP